MKMKKVVHVKDAKTGKQSDFTQNKKAKWTPKEMVQIN